MAFSELLIAKVHDEHKIQQGRELYLDRLSGLRTFDQLNYWLKTDRSNLSFYELHFGPKKVEDNVKPITEIDRLVDLFNTQPDYEEYKPVLEGLFNPNGIMGVLESCYKHLGVIYGELKEYESDRKFAKITHLVQDPEMPMELLPALVRSFEIQVRDRDGVYILSEATSPEAQIALEMSYYQQTQDENPLTYKWLRGS